MYLHDAEASLGSWRTLLDAALAGRVSEAAMAETAARLGMARQLEALSRTDEAIAELRTIVAAEPVSPHGALADARQRLARLRAR